MGCGDGACTKIVRFIFFAFNFIFWVLGIVVLGVGIYSRVENDSWKELIDANTFFAAANLLIAAGTIVAFIGFFGCLGAFKKLKILLGIYCGLVILIFILEIAGGAYAYAKREVVETQLAKGVEKSVSKSYGDASNTAGKGFTKVIDWFQQEVKCCGSEGPADWQKSTWYSTKFTKEANKALVANKAKNVPDTCCKEKKKDCGLNLASWKDKKIYTQGCIAGGKQYAKDNLYLIGGVGVGIAVVELLAIAFAIGLIVAFKKEEKATTA